MELMEEARRMVDFDHPNVVTLYGLSLDGELALVCTSLCAPEFGVLCGALVGFHIQ